jgi:FkbM family methyltransferase
MRCPRRTGCNGRRHKEGFFMDAGAVQKPADPYLSLRYGQEKLQTLLNAAACIVSDRTRRVGLRQRGALYEIHVDDAVLLAPGPRRWRHYLYGVDKRLEQVAARYGFANLRPANPGEWVIDVGGYMGEWSLAMLRRGFNVLVVEPDPTAAYCLRENLKAHAPAGSVWIHEPRAALDKEGMVEFFAEPMNADSSVFQSSRYKSRSIRVEAATLDTIVASHIPPEATLRAFKMDAEGAEAEVLAGATGVLKRLHQVGIDVGERPEYASKVDYKAMLADCGLALSERETARTGALVAYREAA